MSTAAALAAEQLYRVVDFCAARDWNANMESEIDECSLAPLSFGYGLTALRYDGMKGRLCGAAAGSTKILLAAPVSASGKFCKSRPESRVSTVEVCRQGSKEKVCRRGV